MQVIYFIFSLTYGKRFCKIIVSAYISDYPGLLADYGYSRPASRKKEKSHAGFYQNS